MRAFPRLKKTFVQRAVAGTLLSALAVGGLAASPQRAAAKEPGAPECSGQPSVGGGDCASAAVGAVLNFIGTFVQMSNIAKAENNAFSQQMASELSARMPGYNVLVFKTDGTTMYDTPYFRNPYIPDMHGVVIDTTRKLRHRDSDGNPIGWDDFRIWVFAGDSTFRNQGDGGYMNWAFIGNDSDTKGITRKPCGKIDCTHVDRILHFPARAVPRVSTHPVPITSGIPGFCLDDWNGNGAPGAKVDAYSCNGTAPQMWVISGSTIRTPAGMCLDVTGAGTANGTPVELWNCSGAPNQQWVPDSKQELVNPASGKCLDVPGWHTNGTQLDIWDCEGSTNEQWRHA